MPAGVSIVIPTWNRRDLLEQFLPSVTRAAAAYAAAGSPCEVVIVDDGGTDGSDAWVREYAKGASVPIRLVRQESNRGFGAACNRGVREAANPLVFLINNDVAVEPEAIGPLAARFDAGPEDLFAVHCRVLDFDSGREVGTGKLGGFARGFLRVHRSYVTRGEVSGPLYSIFASGGSAIFDRRKFLDLGGFDPLFAPFYLEDVELSYRAWKRGLTICYEPHSVVRHKFSSTIEPLAGRQIPRIALRNRMMLHWIHLHDRRLFASHVMWIAILLMSAPARPGIAIGFAAALRRLPAIRARRREERRQATRTDEGVLKVFADLARRQDVRPYDDPRELE